MKNTSKKWFLVLLIPLTALFFAKVDTQYKYVGTAGDLTAIVNPINTLTSNSFAFRPNINNGYIDTAASLLGLNSPYVLYESALFKLGLSQPLRTYLFIFLLSILGCLNMYYYLSFKYKSNKSSETNLILLSILYGFSPYFINYYSPGHFLFLLLPTFFPLVQGIFEKIISSSKSDIRLSIKHFCLLSLILLLLCTPFSNIGVLTIFICIMLGQLIIYILLKQINIKQFVVSFLLFFLSLFISNIWWLAPYFVTMGNISTMGEQSRQTIGGSIRVATANSSVINVISGFPEGINTGEFLPVLQILLLSLLILGFIVTLISKKKINTGLLLIIIITLFFTKGPNPPLDSIFNYLYEKIVYLQIIRRPASKLYWVFIFFIISIMWSAISDIPNKRKFWSILIGMFLFSSTLLAIFVNFRHISLTPFNIPSSYIEANQYLIGNGVNKILLLPDLGGLNPEYNQELNYHKGIDFLGQIWEFKKYIPSSTNWTIKDPERDEINLMANNIYINNNFCEQSANLNISHIVLRKDLLPTNYDQKTLDEADRLLSTSIYVSQIKEFKNNFKTFELVDRCQSKLISTEPETKIKFEKIDPTKFKVRLSTKAEKVIIIYREKFDKSWVLHSGSLGNFLSQIIPALKNKETVFTHGLALDYANGWTVDLSDLCSKSKNNCVKNVDQYEVDLYIEYWPQRLFYLGLTLSLISYALCIGYLCYSIFSKKNINSKL